MTFSLTPPMNSRDSYYYPPILQMASETGTQREHGQHHNSNPGSLTSEPVPLATRLVFAHLCALSHVLPATHLSSFEPFSAVRQAIKTIIPTLKMRDVDN